MLKQVMDLFEILDDPQASGEAVKKLFEEHGFGDCVEVQTLESQKGVTDLVRIIIKGTNGKLSGGTAPTLGVTGRLGGLGARPELIGFVSDGDGALTALSAALKLCLMKKKGDCLPGDVIVTTHVCPHAPTAPHFPTPFMGSPVEMETINRLEVEMDVDAVLSADTTKGNKIICKRGFAISCPVKEGYILKASDDLVEIMSRVTGQPAYVFPLSIQDITPYGNGIYHMNSILQPSVATSAPVVGIAITTETPVAGCATGATHLTDVEEAARFIVEVAKDFTCGKCSFYDKDEYEKILELYGDLRHFQKKHR